MRSRSLVLHVLLTLAIVGCRSEPIATTLPARFGTALAPINNFGVSSPDIWRGARPTDKGYQWLAAAGVRTIIDLQQQDQTAYIPSNVTYVPIRVSAWSVTEMDTDRVAEAIGKAKKPVYIHCEQGRDRTGLAIAAYRLSRGDEKADVLAELDAHRVNFWWRDRIRGRIDELAQKCDVATTQPSP